MTYILAFAILVIVSDVNLVPINQPDFFAGLEPILEKSYKSHGSADSRNDDHSSDSEMSKEDLLAEIKKNMNDLFRNYINSDDATKNEKKDKQSTTNAQIIENTIEQKDARSDSLSNDNTDQTKVLLKSILDVLKSNNISGIRPEENVPEINTSTQLNTSIVASKNTDAQSNVDHLILNNPKANHLNSNLDVSNNIATTATSIVTFQDLQEAISRLVAALDKKPVPDLDSLQFKNIQQLEQNKEDLKEIDEPVKNTESISKEKQPTHPDLTNALNEVIKHLPSHNQHSNNELGKKVDQGSESHVGISKQNEDDGMTFEKFKEIFYKTYFPSYVENDQQKVIMLGRKDGYDQKDDFNNKKMADLYEEIRKATEYETNHARMAREEKKKELVSLLNEILKPEDRVVYNGHTVSLQNKRNFKNLANEEDDEILKIFNKKSSNLNDYENHKDVVREDSTSVGKNSSTLNRRAALINYLNKFIAKLEKNFNKKNDDLYSSSDSQVDAQNYKNFVQALLKHIDSGTDYYYKFDKSR
ncbi:uncharacterized protein LOC100203497 isoform X4 [Hydra vulgaris]